MSQRTLRYLFFILLVAPVYAQTDPPAKKSVLDKAKDIYHTSSNIYNQASPLVSAFTNGGIGGLTQALNGTGAQATPHPQFPQCMIQKTFPDIRSICKVDSGAKINNEIIEYLGKLKGQYQVGLPDVANEGISNQGIACLNQRKSDIDVDFGKIEKSLDDSITAWTVKHAEFLKQIDLEKEKLAADYNILYTGKNNKFNPVTNLLAKPGCESMFDETGIKNSYENTNGEKMGGLLGIRKSQEYRTTDATTFLKNADLIEKDLNVTLNQLEMNLRNTSMKDLTSTSPTNKIDETLMGQATHQSQYSITENPAFKLNLTASLTDMKTKRQGIINKFSEYMTTEPEDKTFMTSLMEGGDADNKMALFASWKNSKKLNCIYKEFGTTSESSLKQKLYSLISPINSKMDKKCNKSCQEYIEKSIALLVDNSDGRSLDEKLAKLATNTSVSVNSVYTLSNPNNPGSKSTLAQMLRTYSASCQKSMAMNKKSYDYIANKIMAPAIAQLANNDKNLRQAIMARMRNELLNCDGKADNFDGCSNVLPSKSSNKSNSSSPFCFKQAASCSAKINQCTNTLNSIIGAATKNMTNTANNINIQVKAFEETMLKDLTTKMDQISQTINLTLNIPALNKYSGYQSKKNIYTFDNPDKTLFSEFPELQKPPLDIKVFDPKDSLKQYITNMESIKQNYSDMKDKIIEKMEKEIEGIKKNYEKSIASLDAEMKRCETITTAVADKQDQCVKDAHETTLHELIDTISGVKSICDKASNKLEIYNKSCNKINEIKTELEAKCKVWNSSENETDVKADAKDEVQNYFDNTVKDALKICISKEPATECDSIYNKIDNDKASGKEYNDMKGDKKKKEKDPTIKK